jgi:hypothetical protein
MNMHRLSASDARRAAVAGLLLVGTFLLCLWLGNYKGGLVYPDGERVGLSIPVAVRETPSWALPLAIAVGVAGATVALLILRWHRR